MHEHSLLCLNSRWDEGSRNILAEDGDTGLTKEEFNKFEIKQHVAV